MSNYQSQWQQDKILNEFLFKNNRGGFFVDIGAHNGYNLSNTYFFEKELGWDGICVEPIPSVFKQLDKNRRCLKINGAAYNKNTLIDFMMNTGYTEMLSGIIDTYCDQHKKRIENEQKQLGGESNIVKVYAFRLEKIFDSRGIKKVDYLTIDTEGSELQVLQGIDFSKVHVNVIDFEENYPQQAQPIYDLLKKNGFKYYKKIKGDTVFINNDLQFSWND